MKTVKYLDKKAAKVTLDFSAQRAIDSAYTFDAANIDEAADTITIANHPYRTGDQVGSVLTAATGVTATVPSATVNVAYWVIYVDKDTIALATSLSNAKAGTKVALTAGACADQYLQRYAFGAIGTGLIIPSGATVTKVFVDVDTDLKSWDGAWGAGNEDAATVALSLQAANDITAAIAISAAGNVWDAGVHGTLIGSPHLDADPAVDITSLLYSALDAASWLKLTADRELTATIAVDAVSAGKLDIYVEYYV
jgi:hypothetical protein